MEESIFCFADYLMTSIKIIFIVSLLMYLSIIKSWFYNNLIELNSTKTCFMNFSINKLSLTGNNYLKANQIHELNINTVTAISDD